jgi:hypothetical protein
MFKKRARSKALVGCPGECAECAQKGLAEFHQRALLAARDLFFDLTHDYQEDHHVEEGSKDELESELLVVNAFLEWCAQVFEHHEAPETEAMRLFINCLDRAREAAQVDTLGPPEEEQDDLSPPPSSPRTVN